MEVPRLGTELELLLPAYSRATATRIPAVSATYTTDHGNAGNLTHLVEARDQTHNLMVPSGFVSAAPRWELRYVPLFNPFIC